MTVTTVQSDHEALRYALAQAESHLTTAKMIARRLDMESVAVDVAQAIKLLDELQS